MRLLVKSLVFTVIVPGAVTVIVPRAILGRFPGSKAVVPAAVRAAGLAAVLAGACLYAAALAAFTFVGRGTPAPVDPPRQLVAAGPYRWTRNPMYVGVALLLAGEAVYFAAVSLAAYALACFVAFHGFVVLYEEPHLGRRFGEAYAAYRVATPRWIPRRKPGPPSSTPGA